MKTIKRDVSTHIFRCLPDLENVYIALLMKILIVGVALLLLAACNLIDEGNTESGISGGGVVAGSNQTNVGDGSDSAWTSTTCNVVDGKIEWRWSEDKNSFSIDNPTSWSTSSSIDITLLEISSCEIDSATKIAYTTKDWLCVGDYVKVNGTNCLIDDISTEEDITGISGGGVVAGSNQTNVGDGSKSSWASSTCRLVEGNTKWNFASKWVFTVTDPDDSDDMGKDPVKINVLERSVCEIDSATKIAYTTKDWLCVDDYVKINGSNCLITAITDDL